MEKNVPIHLASADATFPYVSEHPNRAQRRMKSSAGNNRKTTPGRRKQVADVMMETQTKFGPVKEATGFTRRIHHSAHNKVGTFLMKLRMKLFAGKGFEKTTEKPTE